MATKTRAELDAYFEADDTPTQSQYQDVFDSFVNIQDDKVLTGGENAITAHVGGGQANATQLTKSVNGITVCASDNDSVKLPATAAGRVIFVSNMTAHICDLYPQAGEQIYGHLADVPHNMAAGISYCFVSDGVIWFGGILS